MAAVAEKREQWSGPYGFLIAAIGSAVGLGNIWRFPGVAYEGGGGAFLLPYLIALLTAGIPILLLDYSLGHRMRGSAPAVFRRLNKRAEPIGWFQVIASFVIMCYYGVIIGWALSYTWYAVDLAWGDDAATFFIEEHLRAEGPGETAEFTFDVVPHLLLPVLIVWVAAFVVLMLGVKKGLERANRIFMPLLVVVFTIMVVRALFLDGAMEGLNAFFTPDFSALADPLVWLTAYGHIFFSLSIAFGIMVTYASYLNRKADLTSTGLVAGFANSSFEILAGIGVFSVLGFMAFSQGVAVADLDGITGVALSFMTFPQIISQMPGGVLFGLLFFGSLAIAGFTSLISISEVVVAALREKFGLSRIVAATGVLVASGTIAALLFATTAGLFHLDVVDKYINEIGIVLGAIVMTVVLSWVLRRLPIQRRHLNAVSDVQIGRWWQVMIGVVVPVVLTGMLLTGAVELLTEGYEEMPNWFLLTFGWGTVACAIIVALVLTAIPWRRPVDDFDEQAEWADQEVPR